MRVFIHITSILFLISCRNRSSETESETAFKVAQKSSDQAKKSMVKAEDLPVKIGVPFEDRKVHYYELLADKGKFSWIEEKIGAVMISTRIRPSLQGLFSSVPREVTDGISSACHQKHGRNIQGAIGCIGAHVSAWEIASKFNWGGVGQGENLRTYCLTYARAILITFETYLKKDAELTSNNRIGYENTPFHILNTISIKNKNGNWYRYAFDVGFDYYDGAIVLYPDDPATARFYLGHGARSPRMANMIKPDTEISQ